MSSHDMAVRTLTSLSVCPGTTLGAVVNAMAPFLQAHRLEVHEDCVDFQDQLAGELLFSEDESSLSLTDQGDLRFYLTCLGDGHGVSPKAFDQMCEGIEVLLQTGGVVEYIDHDISASNMTAVIGIYIHSPKHIVDNPDLERDLVYVRDRLSKTLSFSVVAAIEYHIRLTASMARFNA